MARILFYTPFEQRARDVESLIIAFREQGHSVVFLTQQAGGPIVDFLRSKSVEVHSSYFPSEKSNWWYLLKHLVRFVSFCYKHRIDIAYSHLESANFVAVMGQYFVPTKVIICRHHIDEGRLYGFDKALYYKLTYRLAKKIVVESRHAIDYMVENEGINRSKIFHINLAYDFELYPKPRAENVSAIREQFPCELLLITVVRLTAYKRPDASIRILKKLIEGGVNAKLIILGRGEMESELQVMIDANDLSHQVFLLGYVQNVIDYLAASDLVVHPSLLDSSSIVVKESGLVAKPVFVCKGIGDFDSYIRDDVNGFIFPANRFEELVPDTIKRVYHDVAHLKGVGVRLQQDVIKRFSITTILPAYETLNAGHYA